MNPSFGKRLTASFFFVVLVTVLFTAAFLTPRLKRIFLRQLEGSLATQASLIAQDVSPLLRATPADLSTQTQIKKFAHLTGCRVTLIRANGVVLGDSERRIEEIGRMDNHLSRPEVQAAIQMGLGESTRYSATLHENMLYVAVPVGGVPPNGGGLGVLRLALSLDNVQKQIAAFQKDLTKAGSAALAVALLVALFSVRRISRPLRELVNLVGRIGSGERPPMSAIGSRDEFGNLAKAFGEMAAHIEQKVGELSRERRQLGAILSSLVESIVAIDHDGRILFLNAAAERLFEVSPTQAKGRPFLEALRHSLLNDVLKRALSERGAVHQEISLHTPAERMIAVNALPVDYGEGQTGVLAALHDVTELRNLENVRREFVANVSHELKTPLTAIQGYVETLLDGAINDPKNNRAFLRTIQEHTENLSRLISDILDLSAIEDQRVTYHFEPVAIREVTERILKGLAPMAKAKEVSITANFPDDLPKVRADREKLAQILMNLIDNAIKFNKTGGRVEISAAASDGQVSLQIKDTGMGIPETDLSRIFERFFRADKSHSHDIPGTGLGLAIVKHLVEDHQGKVTAQSRPGQGSIFIITLPAI